MDKKKKPGEVERRARGVGREVEGGEEWKEAKRERERKERERGGEGEKSERERERGERGEGIGV